MEFLTRPCLKCQNPMNGGVYRALYLCPHCFFEHEGGKKKKRRGKVATATSDVDTLRTEAVKADRAAVTPGIMEVEEIYADEVAAVEPATQEPVQAPAEPVQAAARQTATVVLTTKALSEQTVVALLEEVTADCVLNLKVTPDLISNGKFIGAKSEKVKAALEQGKKHVLNQLRQKAQERGANIVTDISVKNAVKTTDSQSVRIIVKAAGQAAVVETAAEASEA